MKTHTREEREEAKKKLPEPVRDFLASPTLTTLHVGIQKKHNLDLRQLMLFADIVNVTLMGLEPESALETSLHQAIHELSNEGARELVADINDRVFKEAKRRIQESIPEPSVWSAKPAAQPALSEEELSDNKRRELIDTMRDDDPELIAAYEHDAKAVEEKRKADDEALAEALAQAAKDPVIKEEEEDNEEGEEGEETAVSTTPAPLPSVALEKLTAPATAKAEPVTLTQKTNGIQRLTLPVQEPVLGPVNPTPIQAAPAVTPPPATPPAPVVPPPSAPSAPATNPHETNQAPRIYKGTDPYREPIE